MFVTHLVMSIDKGSDVFTHTYDSESKGWPQSLIQRLKVRIVGCVCGPLANS